MISAQAILAVDTVTIGVPIKYISFSSLTLGNIILASYVLAADNILRFDIKKVPIESIIVSLTYNSSSGILL